MKFAISLKHRLLFFTRSLEPALFMHIQKTAGTSLIDQLRRYYKQDMVTHGDYLYHSVEELSKYTLVSGHFGYAYAEPLIRSRYAFTFLRDPVERVLSFYYFCRQSNPYTYPIYRLAHELELEAFLQAGLEDMAVKSYIWNQQTWALACGPGNPGPRLINEYPENEMLELAIAHLDDFSHIGFTETFDRDMAIVLAALRLPNPIAQEKSNTTRQKPERDAISEKALHLAEALTSLDSKLYSAAWTRRKHLASGPTLMI